MRVNLTCQCGIYHCNAYGLTLPVSVVLQHAVLGVALDRDAGPVVDEVCLGAVSQTAGDEGERPPLVTLLTRLQTLLSVAPHVRALQAREPAH